MGIVHGIVGAGAILSRGKDDFTNRAISGCTAGASLGIARRLITFLPITINCVEGKVGLACGMCLGISVLSMFEKATSSIITMPFDQSAPKGHAALDPVFLKDERIKEGWVEHLHMVQKLEIQQK